MTTVLPRLSIVTPVYNADRFIAETIASVEAQLADDDDYIVIDDGSNDGSASVMARVARRARIVRQPNSGEVAAVNAGVASARHDIVAVVNADDPILPGLLDAVRLAFATDSTLDAVYPDWVKIDADGRRIEDVTTADYDYAAMLEQHMCIPGPGAFFKRSTLRGEPVRVATASGISDYEFWLRYGRRGARIMRLAQPLATWRLHDEGTTVAGQGAALAATKVAVIESILALPDLDREMLARGRQALSAAYYNAALVGLRTHGVPAFRYAIQSYRLAPRWPTHFISHRRRSLPHLIYAALQPLSGAVHAVVSPALPYRYSREAVMRQTFGLHVQARTSR